MRVPQRRGKDRGLREGGKDYVLLRCDYWRILAQAVLIFLEGIDFHPTFENRHGVDAVSLVDQFLEQVGKGRLADAAGFVKPRRLIPFLRTAVAVLQRLCAFLGKHRHADKFAVHVVERKVLADFHDPVFLVSHDESRVGTVSGGFRKGHEIRIDMRGRSATLVLVLPGQVHDEGDIGRTLESFSSMVLSKMMSP